MERLLHDKLQEELVNERIKATSYGKNVRLKHLSNLIGNIRYYKAIDFGCREGYLLHNIEAQQKIGYDLCPEELFRDISYIREDICKVKEKDADLLICSEVIEHIEDDIAALINMYYSLKIGGNIFLTTINENVSEDKYEADKARGHLRRYGIGFKGVMESIGFETLSFYPIRRKHYYENKGKFHNYNPQIDRMLGEKNASGLVYFGRKNK